MFLWMRASGLNVIEYKVTQLGEKIHSCCNIVASNVELILFRSRPGMRRPEDGLFTLL